MEWAWSSLQYMGTDVRKRIVNYHEADTEDSGYGLTQVTTRKNICLKPNIWLTAIYLASIKKGSLLSMIALEFKRLQCTGLDDRKDLQQVS